MNPSGGPDSVWRTIRAQLFSSRWRMGGTAVAGKVAWARGTATVAALEKLGPADSLELEQPAAVPEPSAPSFPPVPSRSTAAHAGARPLARARWMTAMLALVQGLGAGWLARSARGEGPSDVTLRVLEPWSAVFAAQPGVFHLVVESERSLAGTVSWSIVMEDRVLARRDVPFAVTPERAATVEVALPRLESIKPIALTMTLAATVREGDTARASTRKALWLFPEDPFVDRSEWLKALDLTLFDPSGATARLLDKAGIPYRATRNPEALLQVRGGLVVLGEGLSFAEYPAIPEVMLAVAESGIGVLCLAPAEGSLAIPGASGPDVLRGTLGSTEHPISVRLRRKDVVATLDDRLDWKGWPPDGRVLASGLRLESERGRVVGRVVGGTEDGWAWLEAEFATGRGRLLLVGFSLAEHWDSGPTPRFLLRRLLETMSRSPSDGASAPTRPSGKKEAIR